MHLGYVTLRAPLRVLWHVGRQFESQFDAFDANPSRDGWLECTRDFLRKLNAHTSGNFSDYAMKIGLDAVLVARPSLQTVVSWFPMAATAYKDDLPLLYPVVQKEDDDDLWLAGCHYHRQMKRTFPRMRLFESLAQICWVKRGLS